LPHWRLAGTSRLTGVAGAFAKGLQLQEKETAQIVATIESRMPEALRDAVNRRREFHAMSPPSAG
jgi:GTP cyclohydrolase I